MRSQEEEVTRPVGVGDLVASLTLRPTGGDRYAGDSSDWWPGARVFGGMVVAQALRAAQMTMSSDMAVNSLHGYFLRPVRPGVPVEVAVRRVRDGRSFAVRQATTTAEGRPVFEMTCSFHRPEEGEEYQLTMPDVPGPDDVAPAGVPIPFDIRELGSTPRRSDGTYQATRRVWFRAAGELPDDPALHAAVLAYISDMTGAAFRPHSLGTWGTHTDASLDHALWFHRPAPVDDWLLYDLQAVVNGGGRALVRGVLFSADGHVVASMAQELLIRLLGEPVRQVRPAWAAGRPPVHPE